MKSNATKYRFRELRVRTKISGHTERPRLTVYRSSKHIYAQIVDDLAGKTIVAASSLEKGLTEGSGVALATKIGESIGKKALAKGINSVVFDRRGRPYHGRVKAVAEGARQAGLKF